MDLELRTTAADDATTGILTAGPLRLFTIEQPWRDNEPNRSCVPPGVYELIPYLSPEHGRTWRLHAPELGVWGKDGSVPEGMRTFIELHPMNFARESEGCIGPGLSGEKMLDALTDQVEPAVQDSDKAFRQLRSLLDGSPDPHTLTIIREGVRVDPRPSPGISAAA